MAAPGRVIVLTGIYPPDIRVGGHRPARLVRKLRDAGISVDVLTDAATGATPGIAPGGERIVVIDRARTLRDRVFASRQARQGTGAAAPGSEASVSRTPKPSWLRRQIRSLLVAPDLDRGLIGPMARGARALLAEGPAIVYSSGPPQSVHLAAWLALRGTRTPWIGGFRDPWSPELFDGFESATLGVRLADSALRRAFRRMDWCVAASEGIGDWWRALGLEAPVLVARNGIPERSADNEPIDVPEAGEGPDLLYIGELYAGRDPRPFLAHLRAAIDAQPATPPPAARFVGQVESYGDAVTASLIDAAGLSGVVTLHPSVPHAEALRLQRASRVLLLLAQRQPLQVPNKLYEYLGARKPILAYVDEAGESARLLQQAGGHFLITERSTADEAVATVRAALDAGRRAEPLGDPAFLEALSSEAQLQFIVDLVQSVGHGRMGWV